MADPLPFIAIVGSANTNRSKYPYEPPLKNVGQVKDACMAIGRELALAGYGIIVYTSSSDYIEADVVSGYVESGAARPKSIQVRYPNIQRAEPRFKEQETHLHLFDFQPVETDNWQASFIPSLKDAAGIVILGGGNSALMTGLVAQAYRKPMVSIATFGGSSENVLRLTAASDNSLATREERRLMNQPMWDSQTAAADLVKVITDQRERLRLEEESRSGAAKQAEQRRAAEERRRATEMKWRAVSAVAFIVIAVVTTLTVMFSPDAYAQRTFGLSLFLTPLLAGAAGGLMTDLFDLFNSGDYKPYHTVVAGAGLGAGAGLFTALFWVVSQWNGNTALQWLNDPSRYREATPAGALLLLIFELLISFTAGLTLEKIFLKWKKEGPYTPKRQKGRTDEAASDDEPNGDED